MRIYFLCSLSILLLAGAGVSVAQVRSQSEREHVRSLNNSILQLHQQLHDSSGGSTRTIRERALQIVKERANSLVSLMASDPEGAAAMVFSPEALAELETRIPGASAWLETPGDWEGPAEYIVLDDASLKSSKSTLTIRHGGDRFNVHFAGAIPDGLACGSVLQVHGNRLGTHILAATAPRITSAASAGSCTTTGQQKVAVILVTFPGVTPPITPSAVYNVFFGTGRSVDGYWRDASFGLTSATGNVFGWYTLPTSYSCDQYSALGTAAMKLADPDVFFPNYNRVFYVFPKPSGCTYGGISTVGCVSQSSADGSFTASNSWLIADYLAPNDQGVELAVHEGGHGLTLNHAQSRGFSPDAIGALGTSGTFSEYGDNFDPMGFYNLGHYGAQHKVQLGWIPASNVLTVQNSGTYNVAPWGVQTSATQALKVQRGTGNPDWLWIEYHQSTGNYESALSGQVFSGATIRYQDAFTAAGYSNLVDFTPLSGSWYDPALAAGLTWKDPYTNVSIAVNSASATAMNVGVTYGSVPCTHANPSVSLTPPNPTAYVGGTVGYSFTVTNNDTAGCAASGFTISSSGPSGWTVSPTASSINLMPGQSTTVALSAAVPTTAVSGMYAITAAAAASSGSAAASANCSVMSGSAVLSGSIPMQSGPDASRDWQLQVSNVGTAMANSAQISYLTLLQTGGKACSPHVMTTMPVALGSLAPNQTVSSDLIINFTGCDNSSKFTINIGLSANSGATSTTITRNNYRK